MLLDWKLQLQVQLVLPHSPATLILGQYLGPPVASSLNHTWSKVMTMASLEKVLAPFLVYLGYWLEPVHLCQSLGLLHLLWLGTSSHYYPMMSCSAILWSASILCSHGYGHCLWVT